MNTRIGRLDALLRPVCPKFEVPRPALGDWADEYISQLNAVRMMPKVSSDGRRYYTLFNLRTSDHLFDCEKMAMTLAIRRGVVLGELPKKDVIKIPNKNNPPRGCCSPGRSIAKEGEMR